MDLTLFYMQSWLKTGFSPIFCTFLRDKWEKNMLISDLREYDFHSLPCLSDIATPCLNIAKTQDSALQWTWFCTSLNVLILHIFQRLDFNIGRKIWMNHVKNCLRDRFLVLSFNTWLWLNFGVYLTSVHCRKATVCPNHAHISYLNHHLRN